eukprot:TRINITY_DN76062_c0_g1_i1.p2 TRINITY_DN76062_c0_g1~~TRINITY_DN76062_c0_g1_i1.p2  ORF type:complete len:381 (-),score=88.95 TRINITY_DN76062_c0_g1_i1:80-1222(-)
MASTIHSAEETLAAIAQSTARLKDLMQQVQAEEAVLKALLKTAADINAADTVGKGTGDAEIPLSAVGQYKPFAEAIKRPSLLGVPNLLRLKKFDTPTISNGLELITKDPKYGWSGFNLENVLDHMPDWGTMVGYAITVKIQPSNRKLVNEKAANRQKFADYVANLELPSDMQDLPKIIVVQDLDVTESSTSGRPFVYGSMWGEVNANFFAKLGVKGCITDGAVRDIPEMKAAGFRALSRTLSPSHSFGGVPLEWDVPVEVFGAVVQPGALIAADRHGFVVIPCNQVGSGPTEESRIVDVAEFGDRLERDYTIAASFSAAGHGFAQINERMSKARAEFGFAKNTQYGSFEERLGAGWAAGDGISPHEQRAAAMIHAKRRRV